HIQVSVVAAEVHALALRIEEEVVGIATPIHGCNGPAFRRGEHAKLRGIPKPNKKSPGTFIQSHWKIAATVDRPTRCLFAGKAVDDRDLARLRHVHEDATVRAGKLETFGVRLQWNVGDLAVRRGIDYRQCAASTTAAPLVRTASTENSWPHDRQDRSSPLLRNLRGETVHQPPHRH